MAQTFLRDCILKMNHIWITCTSGILSPFFELGKDQLPQRLVSNFFTPSEAKHNLVLRREKLNWRTSSQRTVVWWSNMKQPASFCVGCLDFVSWSSRFPYQDVCQASHPKAKLNWEGFIFTVRFDSENESQAIWSTSAAPINYRVPLAPLVKINRVKAL